LYGAAREIIKEMTGRGIFRKIQFPTVSFAELPKKDGSKDEGELQKTKKTVQN
jgi:hypothetical protein